MVRIVETLGGFVTERLQEFNPNHDQRGRFAPKTVAGGGGGVATEEQVDALRTYALGEDSQELDAWLRLSHGDIGRADDVRNDANFRDARGNTKLIKQVHAMDAAFDNPKLATTFKSDTRVHALPGEIGGGVPAGQTRNQWTYTLVSQKPTSGSTPLDVPAGTKAINLSVTKTGTDFHPNMDAQLLPRGLKVTSNGDGSFAVTGKATFTEANPYHDQKGRFASKKLGAAVAQVEGEIRGMAGGETVVALDDEGNEVHRIESMGDPDGPGPLAAGVNLDEYDVERMRGMTTIHNHPRTSGYGDNPVSFSGADLRTTYQIGPKEMRVVNPDGTVFTMRPGPDGWGAPVHINRAIEQSRATAVKQFMRHVEAGNLDRATANAQASVFISRAVAGTMGWQFEELRP